MRKQRNATKCDNPLQSARLTVAQENAADALATGKTDAEVAGLLNLHRTTISRWRLYNPHFIAALNERRKAIWAASLDRLRSLVGKALDVLGDEMEKPDSPNRLTAATHALKLVPMQLPPVGSTDPQVIVNQITEQRRAKVREPLKDLLDGRGLPRFEDDVRTTWQDLAEKLQDDDANEPDMQR